MTRPYPKLPRSAYELIRAGVWTIYKAELSSKQVEIILTDKGLIYELSPDGIAMGPVDQSLKEYKLIEFVTLPQPDWEACPVIKIDISPPKTGWDRTKQRLAEFLFGRIAHGDEQHRAWLKDELVKALDDFDSMTSAD